MLKNLGAAVGIALVFGTTIVPSAHATVFQPVIDEFYIIKDGTTIFDDTFGDGTLPPSGPDGPQPIPSLVRVE